MPLSKLASPVNRYRVRTLRAPVMAEPSFFSDVIKVMPAGSILAECRGGSGPQSKGVLFDWLRVSMSRKQRPIEGYVPKAFVEPIASTGLLPEAHLEKPLGTVKRSGLGRAYRLNEEPMPRRPPGGSDTAIFDTIIQWLDVERSARYQPGGKTYCNIYACDFVHLCGAYLPRVWWYPPALARIMAGEAVVPDYANTVGELNANSLYDWLVAHGSAFGWTRVATLTEAQDAANSGKLVVMSAKRANPEESGHISMIVPETAEHKAKRKDGLVIAPLQSQAGRTNHKYYAENWGTSDIYAGRGLWVHA